MERQRVYGGLRQGAPEPGPSMVERACRAMARGVEQRDCPPAPDGTPGWALCGYASLDAWVDAAWPNYVPMLMDALREMFTPSRAVTRAIANRAWHSGSGVDPADVWRDAISAAAQHTEQHKGE